MSNVTINITNLETGSTTTSINPTTGEGKWVADLGNLRPDATHAEGDNIRIVATAPDGRTNTMVVPRGAVAPQIVNITLSATRSSAPPASPMSPAGEGGGAPPAPVMNVLVNLATGAVTSSTTLTVEKATLTIPEGTIIKDAEGNPLSTSITTLHRPTIAESVGAIAAYDFGPRGITFEPPIDLVIAYDPADLPEGFRESDLVIRMWDGTAWVDLATTVDTVTHTATAKVSHFTIFALFAAPPVAPPPTPPPVPTITPTPTPAPPFPVVPLVAIIAIVVTVIIVAVAYVVLRRKRK